MENEQKGLRFNICGIETSYQLNSEVKGISQRIEEAIPPELVYATQYWAEHLQSASEDSELLHKLEHLMYTKFLFWLEVLSLKGKISVASVALIKSRKRVQVSLMFPVPYI
jgi:hypothetical protein